jgi:hypothetical protein
MFYVENRPGGSENLSDLWPLMFRVYGSIALIVLALLLCIWAVNKSTHRINPQILSVAVLTEHMEESVGDTHVDFWFFGVQQGVLYRDVE